jgi:3-isopropylmalate/(R)-2-methylmalate dehydratase large subunit
MAMTILEKILAVHSKFDVAKPGDILDINIDTRIARDFGGANVVKKLRDHNLSIEDIGKTFFTFDCNPTGSDQKYAVNQQLCRIYARENNIKVYDIDAGIGTHIMIDEGLVVPGSTAISTDSHANIIGAIGAFGQGMGDIDIAAGWTNGKVWFKVPESVRINLAGKIPDYLSAKDIALNLLNIFGANTLLGYSVELYGEAVENLTLDQRITISSMATEMGAIIILIPPSDEIVDYCSHQSGKRAIPVLADPHATYNKIINLDLKTFGNLIARPGAPHDTANISEVYGIKVDSGFIGSCTNGRLEDMQKAADILKDKKVAPGVVLKIVPSTDSVWRECLDRGLIGIFKKAGALVSNAGCAGCAAGQVGQNGPGEITVSTGNRNFPGKQGKGSVYLASPEIVAASCIAGFLTTPDRIPDQPAQFKPIKTPSVMSVKAATKLTKADKPEQVEGRIWVINIDNIDTDMIFHNRYLSITDIREMGQYAFDNLKGSEDFAKNALPGDIILTGKNFGSGSSRQQAVDCFVSLGIQAIIAGSFGSIYERNAINAGFPVLTCNYISDLKPVNGDIIRINFLSGQITNLNKGISVPAQPFSEVQHDIYRNGGLF